MTDELVLSVPEALPAMYLIPGSMPVAKAHVRAATALAAQVAEPLRSLAGAMLRTSVVLVGTRPAAEFTALRPLETAGAVSLEHAAVVARATEFIAFGALVPPRPGPVHEWVTRAIAGAFAAELGLPVIDTFMHRAMTGPAALGILPGAPELTGIYGGFRLSDWLTVHQAGQCLTTRGLGRFGLPELSIDQVPAGLATHWTFALAGLGHRLLELLRRELRAGSRPAFLRIPAEMVISRANVGSAYGLDLRDGAGMPVRLTLDPATSDQVDSYLTVDAPRHWPLAAAAHRLAVRDALFGPDMTPVMTAASRARRSRPGTGTGRRGTARRAPLPG